MEVKLACEFTVEPTYYMALVANTAASECAPMVFAKCVELGFTCTCILKCKKLISNIVN